MGVTLPDQLAGLAMARDVDPDLGFPGRMRALCSLPRVNPGKSSHFIRRNGPLSLTMTAGNPAKLPYENLPSLLWAWGLHRGRPPRRRYRRQDGLLVGLRPAGHRQPLSQRDPAVGAVLPLHPPAARPCRPQLPSRAPSFHLGPRSLSLAHLPNLHPQKGASLDLEAGLRSARLSSRQARR